MLSLNKQFWLGVRENDPFKIETCVSLAVETLC